MSNDNIPRYENQELEIALQRTLLLKQQYIEEIRQLEVQIEYMERYVQEIQEEQERRLQQIGHLERLGIQMEQIEQQIEKKEEQIDIREEQIDILDDRIQAIGLYTEQATNLLRRFYEDSEINLNPRNIKDIKDLYIIFDDVTGLLLNYENIKKITQKMNPSIMNILVDSITPVHYLMSNIMLTLDIYKMLKPFITTHTLNLVSDAGRTPIGELYLRQLSGNPNFVKAIINLYHDEPEFLCLFYNYLDPNYRINDIRSEMIKLRTYMRVQYRNQLINCGIKRSREEGEQDFKYRKLLHELDKGTGIPYDVLIDKIDKYSGGSFNGQSYGRKKISKKITKNKK
jgi:hypothetical protein